MVPLGWETQPQWKQRWKIVSTAVRTCAPSRPDERREGFSLPRGGSRTDEFLPLPGAAASSTAPTCVPPESVFRRCCCCCYCKRCYFLRKKMFIIIVRVNKRRKRRGMKTPQEKCDITPTRLPPPCPTLAPPPLLPTVLYFSPQPWRPRTRPRPPRFLGKASRATVPTSRLPERRNRLHLS